MDLDQLQSVRDRERESDDLQELRESFYADAAAFVADLRAERAAAAEAAEDPFDSPRVSRLTDRIRTAEQTLEAIYEKRIGKVVKSATFAAADLPAEAEGMTAEEADLFETLVGEIRANREEVLGGLAEADEEIPGDVPAPNAMGSGETAAPPAEAEAPATPTTDDGNDGSDAETEGGEEQSDVDRQLVRITDDVGAILGVDDREYELAEDDVVTLPAANARPLIEQGAAERLE